MKRTTLHAVIVGALTGTTAPLMAQGTKPEFVIVAIGDSYASGEGAPQRPGTHSALQIPPWRGDPTEIWTVTSDPGAALDARRCHRSPRAGAAVAAESLQARFPEVKITFVSFACSGAKIDAGVIGPYVGQEAEFKNQNPLRPQLEQINSYFANRANKRIDALVMGIGGNNMDFAQIMIVCLILHVPELRSGCQNSALLPDVSANLARLPGLYRRLDDAINGRGTGVKLDAALQPGRVYITEYPRMLNAGPPGSGPAGNPDNLCDGSQTTDYVYDNANIAESKFLTEQVLFPLNQAVRDAAAAATPNRWRVVTGIADAFFAHGVCARDPYFRTNTDALRMQGNDGHIAVNVLGRMVIAPTPFSAGAIHPNDAGYRAVAGRLIPMLDAHIRERFSSITLAVAAPQLSIVDVNAGTRLTSAGLASAPTVAISSARTTPTDGTSGRVTLRWTDPIAGGAQRFVLDINGQRRELPRGTVSFTHAGDGRFRIQVRACQALGCSPPSNEQVVSTVVPGAPANLRRSTSPGVQQIAGTIPLAWTAADQFQEYYEVHYREGATAGTQRTALGDARTASKSGTAFLVMRAAGTQERLGSLADPLARGASYAIKVRSCSRVGCSSFSDTITEGVGGTAQVARPPDE